MPNRLPHSSDRQQDRAHDDAGFETIGELLAENMELREQIADIVLQTASLRETLENEWTRH